MYLEAFFEFYQKAILIYLVKSFYSLPLIFRNIYREEGGKVVRKNIW